DGWRYFSPSSLIRTYGDLGYRTQDAEVHLVAQGASTDLGIIGATPVQLLQQDYRSVFTNPQTNQNEMGSLALNTKVNVSPTWTIQDNMYLRSFFQHHVDGNDANVGDCGLLGGGASSGTLCNSDSGNAL